MSPAVIVLALLVLIVSQLLYALGPFRRRAFLPILVLSCAGVAAGQIWANAGLPAMKLGEADVLPAVPFALVLQAFEPFLVRLTQSVKRSAPE